MENYHGILVNVSQKNKNIFSKLKILSQKEGGSWTLYKISINPAYLEKSLEEIQKNLVDGFYFHAYRNNELIVVFTNKIFRVKTVETAWKEVIEYGKSLGIPEEQLDFCPCKVKEELY